MCFSLDCDELPRDVVGLLSCVNPRKLTCALFLLHTRVQTSARLQTTSRDCAAITLRMRDCIMFGVCVCARLSIVFLAGRISVFFVSGLSVDVTDLSIIVECLHSESYRWLCLHSSPASSSTSTSTFQEFEGDRTREVAVYRRLHAISVHVWQLESRPDRTIPSFYETFCWFVCMQIVHVMMSLY